MLFSSFEWKEFKGSVFEKKIYFFLRKDWSLFLLHTRKQAALPIPMKVPVFSRRINKEVHSVVLSTRHGSKKSLELSQWLQYALCIDPSFLLWYVKLFLSRVKFFRAVSYIWNSRIAEKKMCEKIHFTRRLLRIFFWNPACTMEVVAHRLAHSFFIPLTKEEVSDTWRHALNFAHFAQIFIKWARSEHPT